MLMKTIKKRWYAHSYSNNGKRSRKKKKLKTGRYPAPPIYILFIIHILLCILICIGKYNNIYIRSMNRTLYYVYLRYVVSNYDEILVFEKRKLVSTCNSYTKSEKAVSTLCANEVLLFYLYIYICHNNYIMKIYTVCLQPVILRRQACLTGYTTTVNSSNSIFFYPRVKFP